MERKLSIAIIGGGIGGLSLALALGNMEGLRVDLYEAAPRFTEKGAGLMLWPRGWEVLRNLGVESDMNAILGRIRDDKPDVVYQFRKGDQERGFSFYNLTVPGGQTNYLRTDLHDVLRRNISPSCHFHLSKRLISYSERTDSVSLAFQDGTSAACDLLIAADGVKSVCRRVVLEDVAKRALTSGKNPSTYLRCIEPLFCGSHIYRCLVQSSVLRECMPNHRALTTPMMYLGKNKHIVSYPLSQGHIVNLVVFRTNLEQEDTVYPNGTWETDASVDEMISHFEAWEHEAKVLMKCAEGPTLWALHVVNPLPTFVSNRAALIGDAVCSSKCPLLARYSFQLKAHAMTTHQAAGASQAIEDAYILASLISNSSRTPDALPHILRIYDEIRRPVANRVLDTSRRQGYCYDLNAPGMEHIVEGDSSVQPEVLADVLRGYIRDWEWQWRTSVETDKEHALAMLRCKNSTREARL